MAKMTNCRFCGKEIPVSEAEWGGEQSISLDIIFKPIPCCENCKKEYDIVAKNDNTRFTIKCKNFKEATKTKLKEEEIVAALKSYKAGRDRYLAPYADCNEAYNSIRTDKRAGCFCYNDDGYFRVAETTIGSEAQFGLDGLDLVMFLSTGIMPAFTKKDVSMLEYRLTSKLPIRTTNGNMYTFEVRLNNEKLISYKPCIANFGIFVPELLTGGMLKDAKKEAAKVMETFKEAMGLDIPVKYVKKFDDITVSATPPQETTTDLFVDKPVLKEISTNDISVENKSVENVQEDKPSVEIEQPTEYSPIQNARDDAVEEKPLTAARLRWMKVRSVACFATLLSTLGFILTYGMDIEQGGLLLTFGFISTIIACPKKMLATCGKIMGVCITFGLTILVVGVIPLAIIGFLASIGLVFFAPAIVSIPYFFKELKLQIKYHR